MKIGKFHVRTFDMGVAFILSKFGVYSYLVEIRIDLFMKLGRVEFSKTSLNLSLLVINSFAISSLESPLKGNSVNIALNYYLQVWRVFSSKVK